MTQLKNACAALQKASTPKSLGVHLDRVLEVCNQRAGTKYKTLPLFMGPMGFPAYGCAVRLQATADMERPWDAAEVADYTYRVSQDLRRG